MYKNLMIKHRMFALALNCLVAVATNAQGQQWSDKNSRRDALDSEADAGLLSGRC